MQRLRVATKSQACQGSGTLHECYSPSIPIPQGALLQTNFDALGLDDDLRRNLASLGYKSMTPIQADSLPPILAGRDVVGHAMTGSGKTAAFGLGLLQKVDVTRFREQALVLCPTRELADQVAGEIRRLARGVHNMKVLTLCGGTAFGPQVGSLAHRAHIIVGTPGRVNEHLAKRTLRLVDLEMLVLDEADRMLDMGFEPVLNEILRHVPKARQTLLFSATYQDATEAIVRRVTRNPVFVKVATVLADADIDQRLYCVADNAERLVAVRLLLAELSPVSSLIFCNTRRETQQVSDALSELGFSALALHGDMEQKDRDETLIRFANKSVSVLVATDVAARGIDIDTIDLVLNYQLARDPEVHIHRIGRTSRAGNNGVACSLIVERERFKLDAIQDYEYQQMREMPFPDKRHMQTRPFYPPMVTLRIDGGKNRKLRPGDILGALTGDSGIPASEVGKIKILARSAYVGVTQDSSKAALALLNEGKIKGREFLVRRVR